MSTLFYYILYCCLPVIQQIGGHEICVPVRRKLLRTVDLKYFVAVLVDDFDGDLAGFGRIERTRIGREFSSLSRICRPACRLVLLIENAALL